jgi:hypothetical protein
MHAGTNYKIRFDFTLTAITLQTNFFLQKNELLDPITNKILKRTCEHKIVPQARHIVGVLESKVLEFLQVKFDTILISSV